MSIGGESNRSRGRPRITGPTILSPGEFEVMEFIWRYGPQSSREVYEKLHASRSLAYTTVMTFLDKLQRKGFIVQEEQGKGSRFTSQVGRQEALQRCLDFFVRSYFEGKIGNLLDFLGERDFPVCSPPVRKEKKRIIKVEREAPTDLPASHLDTDLDTELL